MLRWEPPRALSLSWQIGPDRTPRPDPADATRVDVLFAPAGGATRVTVEHSGSDRPGAGGDAHRAAMAEQGWPHTLERFAASVREAGLR